MSIRRQSTEGTSPIGQIVCASEGPAMRHTPCHSPFDIHLRGRPTTPQAIPSGPWDRYSFHWPRHPLHRVPGDRRSAYPALAAAERPHGSPMTCAPPELSSSPMAAWRVFPCGRRVALNRPLRPATLVDAAHPFCCVGLGASPFARITPTGRCGWGCDRRGQTRVRPPDRADLGSAPWTRGGCGGACAGHGGRAVGV